MAPGYWVPEQEGALPEKLPLILESLKNVKDQTVVLSGIWSKSAEPPEGTTGSDHWVAAAFLTGIKPRKTAGSDATVGSPTIDQIIARKIGQETLLPSLQLAVEDPNSSSSNCGEGYSCSYTNSISWIDVPTPAMEEVQRTSPMPMELNPQVVFERLFGSGATPEVRAARMRQNRSILDSVLGELAGLKKDLGAEDRRTVGRYTDEIREIERRIQIAAGVTDKVPVIDLPPGVPEQFDDHVKLQFDLAALAHYEPDHLVVSQRPEGSTVLAVAAKRDDLGAFIAAVEARGIHPRALYAGPVLYRSLLRPVPVGEGEVAPCHAVLDFGHLRTNVCIVRGGQTLSARTIRRGSAQLTDAIAKAFKADEARAEEAKRGEAFLVSPGRPATSPLATKLDAVLREALAPMIRELRQTLASFSSSARLDVGALLVVGGGGRLGGLLPFSKPSSASPCASSRFARCSRPARRPACRSSRARSRPRPSRTARRSPAPS